MSGIGLLLIFGIFIWFAIFLVNFAFKQFPKKYSFLVLALIIASPFADAFFGRKYLDVKCADLSAVTVERVINNVEGIYYHYASSKGSPNYFGYKFVEGGGSFSGLDQKEFLVNRTWRTGESESRVPAKALYEIFEEPRKDSFYYYSVRTVVRERVTQKEIANYTWISFRGGWAERIPMALSGAGPGPVASCGNSEQKHQRDIEALHRSLIPL